MLMGRFKRGVARAIMRSACDARTDATHALTACREHEHWSPGRTDPRRTTVAYFEAFLAAFLRAAHHFFIRSEATFFSAGDMGGLPRFLAAFFLPDPGGRPLRFGAAPPCKTSMARLSRSLSSMSARRASETAMGVRVAEHPGRLQDGQTDSNRCTKRPHSRYCERRSTTTC